MDGDRLSVFYRRPGITSLIDTIVIAEIALCLSQTWIGRRGAFGIDIPVLHDSARSPFSSPLQDCLP